MHRAPHGASGGRVLSGTGSGRGRREGCDGMGFARRPAGFMGVHCESPRGARSGACPQSGLAALQRLQGRIPHERGTRSGPGSGSRRPHSSGRRTRSMWCRAGVSLRLHASNPEPRPSARPGPCGPCPVPGRLAAGTGSRAAKPVSLAGAEKARPATECRARLENLSGMRLYVIFSRGCFSPIRNSFLPGDASGQFQQPARAHASMRSRKARDAIAAGLGAGPGPRCAASWWQRPCSRMAARPAGTACEKGTARFRPSHPAGCLRGRTGARPSAIRRPPRRRYCVPRSARAASAAAKCAIWSACALAKPGRLQARAT